MQQQFCIITFTPPPPPDISVIPLSPSESVLLQYASKKSGANDDGGFDNNAIFPFRGRHSGKGPAAVSNQLSLINLSKMAFMPHRHVSSEVWLT